MNQPMIGLKYQFNIDQVVLVSTEIMKPIWALYLSTQYPFLKAYKIALRRYKKMEMQIRG